MSDPRDDYILGDSTGSRAYARAAMTQDNLQQLIERLRRTETGQNGEPVNIDGPEAADLLLSNSIKIEGLKALVHESLYHLRIDEAAKAYHERAEAALGSPTIDPRSKSDGFNPFTHGVQDFIDHLRRKAKTADDIGDSTDFTEAADRLTYYTTDPRDAQP